jgi:hypothetical protein
LRVQRTISPITPGLTATGRFGDTMISTGASAAAAANTDERAQAAAVYVARHLDGPLAGTAESRSEPSVAPTVVATGAAPAGDSDSRCLERLRGADVAALGTLYDRHGGSAFALAHRMTGSPQTAETVVLEAFLDLWRGADRLPPGGGDVGRRLLTAVRHRAIDHLRGRAAVPARRGWMAEGRIEVRP